MTHVRRYRYNRPEMLPVDWDYEFDGDWDAMLELAGMERSGIREFGYDDEEISIGLLTEEWHGHPAGSLVVSGLLVEDHPFAVVEQDDDK
jgi:hypothetical protein